MQWSTSAMAQSSSEEWIWSRDLTLGMLDGWGILIKWLRDICQKILLAYLPFFFLATKLLSAVARRLQLFPFFFCHKMPTRLHCLQRSHLRVWIPSRPVSGKFWTLLKALSIVLWGESTSVWLMLIWRSSRFFSIAELLDCGPRQRFFQFRRARIVENTVFARLMSKKFCKNNCKKLIFLLPASRRFKEDLSVTFPRFSDM